MADFPNQNVLFGGVAYYFHPEQRFLFSENGLFYATLGTDGRLAIWYGSNSNGLPVPQSPTEWFTPTLGDPPADSAWTIGMYNGVLRIFSMPIVHMGTGGSWTSHGTNGFRDPNWSSVAQNLYAPNAYTNAYCILQNDGSLCIYNPPGYVGSPAEFQPPVPNTIGSKNSLWHSPPPPPAPPQPDHTQNTFQQNGGFVATFSVRWAHGGESGQTKACYLGWSTTVDISEIGSYPPDGTSCWACAHIQGGKDVESEANFNYYLNFTGSNPNYTIEGTIFDPSFVNFIPA